MANPILSPEQIKQLRDAIAKIPQLRAEIERAKRAGIDVAMYEQQLAAVEKDARALETVYGGTTAGTVRK